MGRSKFVLLRGRHGREFEIDRSDADDGRGPDPAPAEKAVQGAKKAITRAMAASSSKAKPSKDLFLAVGGHRRNRPSYRGEGNDGLPRKFSPARENIPDSTQIKNMLNVKRHTGRIGAALITAEAKYPFSGARIKSFSEELLGEKEWPEFSCARSLCHNAALEPSFMNPGGAVTPG